MNNGDARDIQYLLNAFLILNIAQFGALIALARLDRKRKRDAARRMAALLPAIQEEEDDTTSASSVDPRKEPVDDSWDPYAPSSSPRLAAKPLTGTVRSLRGLAAPSTSTATEQTIPLLRSPSVASTVRHSRYSSTTSQHSSRVVRTKREIRRGEFFAVISGISIAFAWVLFIGVAWLRLRSKEERTAQLPRNY